MSPPCQPWSLGGKSQGFLSTNGLSMAQSFRKIRKVRPISVCFECADQIANHNRFKIIKSAMKIAGYNLHWSTTMPLDQFGMQRSRWLAVWMRQDVEAKPQDIMKVCNVQMMKWNHPLHQFQIPDQIEHQLKLSKELLEMYGNIDYLPRSSRTKLGPNPSVTDVLHARCVDENTIIPTLVASYPQQHLIDPSHLKNKGIFAFLCEGPQGFKFVDPIRFVSMLGAPVTEIVPIPIKLSVAFRQLGNSISVPHAITAILVALVACKRLEVQIGITINQCWSERILSNNAAVIRNRDFAFVVPWKFLAETIANNCLEQSKSICNQQMLKVHFFGIGTCEIKGLSINSSFKDVIRAFGFQNNENLIFKNGKRSIQEKEVLSNIVGETIEGNFQGLPWGSFVLSFLDCSFGTAPHEMKDELDLAIAENIKEVEVKAAKESSISPTIPYIVESGIPTEKFNVTAPHDQTMSVGSANECHLTSTPGQYDNVWIFHQDSQKPTQVCWPKNLSSEAATLRIRFAIAPDQTEIHYVCECKRHNIQNVDRVFILIPHRISPDFSVVLVNAPSTNWIGVKITLKDTIPWNIAIKECPDTSSIKINGITINQFVRTTVHDGDYVELSSKKPKNCESQIDEKCRAEIFHRQGRALAIDECNWFVRCIQKCNDVFAHEVVTPEAFLVSISNFVEQHRNAQRKVTCIPILFPGHWAACEIRGREMIHLAFINLPHESRAFRDETGNRIELILNIKCKIDKHIIRNQQGFCGWTILFRWWKGIPMLSHDVNEFESSQRDPFEPLMQTLGDQPEDIRDIVVWEFAIFLRIRFVRACPTTNLQQDQLEEILT